jgi:hypothetical protein
MLRKRSFVSLMPVIALAAMTAGCASGPSGSATDPPGATTAVTATAGASEASATRPALTETFTSDLHGISVSYPTGWVPRAATEPWPAGEFVQQSTSFGDVIEDGSAGDTAFIALASQPLAGRSLDEWVADYGPFTECGSPEPVIVDGAAGVVGPDCPMALVTAGDRVFLIWLYRIEDPDWFEEILATVKLDPDAAVDSAS